MYEVRVGIEIIMAVEQFEAALCLAARISKQRQVDVDIWDGTRVVATRYVKPIAVPERMYHIPDLWTTHTWEEFFDV